MTEEELKGWKIQRKIQVFEELDEGIITHDQYRRRLEEIDMIT